MSRHGFIVAATSSGCGKTTLSLGLMRQLYRRGLSVIPFKCGPDYIDPQFHTQATGNESINLDTFFSSPRNVNDLFLRCSAHKDVSVVEGVMGMFDGYSKMAGSSAELSKILSLPVILLVNAASTAYSVAATIFGFKNFHPEIPIAGVIFNRVSSPTHFSFLRDACQDAGVECLGYIKKNPLLATPSRHLGLTLTAREEMESFINSAADAVAENVDIPRLLELTKLSDSPITFQKKYPPSDKIVAVANDEAFNFIYPANLDRLRSQGFKIVRFSPLRDSRLPGADLVYLPGGYPELFASRLSANLGMKESIRQYVERGGRLWAECGGLIYLTRELDGNPMCGLLPLVCTMERAGLSLGYRNVCFGNLTFKGHEFHYSRITNPDSIETVAVQTNVRNKVVPTPVYRYKNLLASYTHLYWADNDLTLLWSIPQSQIQS